MRDQIGNNNEIYLPFIYTLFWILLIINLNGNVPYSYTVTTSIIAALGLSIFVFISVTILGLSIHRLHFFSFFVPSGTPLALVSPLVLIEIISYLARSLSLGLRIWANFVAGHTLLKILSSFLGQLFITCIFTAIFTLIPFIVFVGLIGLEISVSLIQAYVFIVLVCSYIRDAIDLH